MTGNGARENGFGALRGVIFDWAGTVVDYGCCAPTETFIEVFRRHGVTVSPAEAREPMGTAKRTHLEMIAAMGRVAAEWQTVHGAPPSAFDIDLLYAEFTPLQLACLPRFSTLIPGTLETVAALRNRGLKIGTTTGYTREMMAIVLTEARRQGFLPDTTVCADEVPAGRPAPWMSLQAARQLGVYPMKALVKVGDTVPDIEEGLNAGMWTIGLAQTGNEVGLTEHELAGLPGAERSRLTAAASERLKRAGAHYVVDGIGDILPLFDDIGARLAAGETP